VFEETLSPLDLRERPASAPMSGIRNVVLKLQLSREGSHLPDERSQSQRCAAEGPQRRRSLGDGPMVRRAFAGKPGIPRQPATGRQMVARLMQQNEG
jgi:hypothetical protein